MTVPILLALGIGVMRTSRQQRLATAVLHNSVASNAGAWRRSPALVFGVVGVAGPGRASGWKGGP